MIAENYHKLTQMTYLRQNLHDQVKSLEKYAFSQSSIISLANAKSLYKFILAIKTLFVHRFSKFLQVLLGKNYDQDFDMKTIFLSFPIQKFSEKNHHQRQVFRL